MHNDAISVLLIDDDSGYAKITEILLGRFEGKRFNLIWKQTGEEGVHELKANPKVDIILMDYFLPGKNGVEIIKQLAEENIWVPVILLTSHKNFQVAIEAMKLGVHDYLVKDEASREAVLPRTIVTVLDNIRLKKQIDDIEKQQLLAQKRAEAIQELIVTICHEFNNPLAAIKISTDIISRQHLDEEERRLLATFMQKIGILEKEIAQLRNIHWGMDAAKMKG